MDRIDLWLSVSHVAYSDLTPQENTRTTSREETRAMRETVLRARARQTERFQSETKTNATMSARDIENHIPLSTPVASLLTTSAAKLKLSPRGYHRIIKVARTIADIAEAPEIEAPHILEALQYRARM